MMVEFKRMPGVGISNGMHRGLGGVPFMCPQHVAAVVMTLTDGYGDEHACVMTRDEASELADALVGVLCDA